MATSIKGKVAVKGKWSMAAAQPPVVVTDDHADFASVAATHIPLRDIQMGKTTSGRIQKKTSQFGNIIIDRDVDVFTFSADKDDMYNGVLRVDTPDKVLKLKVFDRYGNLLGDYQTSISITLAFETPESKQYYIAVYGKEADDEIDYKMKIIKVVDR